MNSKLFYGGIVIVVVGFFVLTFALKGPEPPRPGVAQEDHKGNHVESKKYSGVEPPTSGDHANTTEWGVHEKEVPDVNVLHNLEHGGIYISYQPDLPKDEIEKIGKLFTLPSSRQEFNPAKAVIAPRAANKAKIVLSSWNRSKTFASFNEQEMYEYYAKNLNKSPEPLAK